MFLHQRTTFLFSSSFFFYNCKCFLLYRLWDILSETSNDLNANMSSSDLENITGASSTEADASGKNQSQKCGSEAPKSHCQFSVFSNTLAEETNKDASTHSCKFNKNFREFENNQDGSLAGCSFKTKPSAEILVADEQHMQYEKVHESKPFPIICSYLVPIIGV